MTLLHSKPESTNQCYDGNNTMLHGITHTFDMYSTIHEFPVMKDKGSSLSNSMEQPSGEANSCSASQKLYLVWNIKIHDCVHNSHN
jgi:hypothetical protein